MTQPSLDRLCHCQAGGRLHSRAGTPAFTLVEMLVSVAISIVMVVVLANVIGQASFTARRASNDLQAMNEAAAAIDMIATDLDSLAVSSGTGEYLQALAESTATDKLPASATGTNALVYKSNAMRLMMLTTSAQDSAVASSTNPSLYPDSGLVHAVCYQVLYQDPLQLPGQSNPVGGTNPIFGLYRTVVSAPTTFTSVMGSSNAFNSFWSVFDLQGAVSATPPTAYQDFIAENVVDLQVAYYQTLISTATPPVTTGTSAGASVIWNPSYGSSYQTVSVTGTGPTVYYSGESISAFAPTPPSGYAAGPPQYAEVSLTLLEQAGAKLWGTGNGTGPSAPASLIKKYGHTLTRRVLLPYPH